MRKDTIIESLTIRKYFISRKLKNLKNKIKVLFYEILIKHNGYYIIKLPDEYDKYLGWKYFKILVKKDNKKLIGKVFKLRFKEQFSLNSISMLDIEFMNTYYDIKCCRSNLWKIGRRINLIKRGN